MPINDNSLDLSKYKGPVDPCPLCFNRTPNAALDAMTSGRACRLCFGKGFIAHCLNCGSTGQYHGKTVWDGGRSDHTSTCTPCGGSGVFPAKQPANWDEDKYREAVSLRNSVLCNCTHAFGVHANHKRSPADLDVWTAGKCKGKIGDIPCPCEAHVVAIVETIAVEPVAATV